MRQGLVGNVIYYGGITAVFSYMGWEIYNMGKNMPAIDLDHPVNEIYEQGRPSKNVAYETMRSSKKKQAEALYAEQMELKRKAAEAVKLNKEKEDGYI
mmetsp:Transcript_71395/g.83059  ORF Transcript_71395/g.83059 Transcript_71395/m.83059 type:complete len:98 (+) Transcript_71395:38-331(+)